MKILVIGGMHGNEPLGIEVVRLLRESPAANVDTLLANEQAIRADVRFTRQDLNRSFPGDVRADLYEQSRAAEIVQTCRDYDLVIDFHNTTCPDNDCSFVGDQADTLLYDVSSWFGLNRVIVADYDCLNKYATNCISIEVSLASERMNAAQWVASIAQLAQIDRVPGAINIERFRFAYRMTLADRDAFELTERGLRAFQAIAPELSSAMGVASPAYPIFIADTYTPYNFGGLLTRIDV